MRPFDDKTAQVLKKEFVQNLSLTMGGGVGGIFLDSKLRIDLNSLLGNFWGSVEKREKLSFLR